MYDMPTRANQISHDSNEIKMENIKNFHIAFVASNEVTKYKMFKKSLG